MEIPVVSVEEAKKIDALAVRYFGLDQIQLMENAGRIIAELSREMLGRIEGKYITILCGKGNNGGDAIISARHLHNWGAKVTVIIPDHPEHITKTNKEQLGVLRSMYVDRLFATNKMIWEDTIRKSHLIIDGLLGYSIDRPPETNYLELIEMVNKHKVKILSIDTPSGLDPDTGNRLQNCINASYTLSLGLMKRGLISDKAKDFVGKLFVGDIGIPHEVYELMGLKIPKIFSKSSLIKYSNGGMFG